jgi:hypothetical protein
MPPVPPFVSRFWRRGAPVRLHDGLAYFSSVGYGPLCCAVNTYQSDIAFLDQIEQGYAPVAIVLRYMDDEPQVSLHHLRFCPVQFPLGACAALSGRLQGGVSWLRPLHVCERLPYRRMDLGLQPQCFPCRQPRTPQAESLVAEPASRWRWRWKSPCPGVPPPET